MCCLVVGASSAHAATPVVVLTETGIIPATVTVSKGEEVQLVINSKLEGMHRFTLPELGLQTRYLRAGDMVTLTFKPEKAGEFTYSVPPSPWKGKLVVK
ncbi:cupredoxin domain-containing protein [Ammoniphilus sp. YIM 78166]|uniref:cupredoxin domain-containing protein n=1 Tax=Ammoniphilus sp. YIM 78166 TaxID=1644106 RepID=UPI0014301445|nr:cupredoxin domain-containing protein [Ammoniphilus sp. YIM 78166]